MCQILHYICAQRNTETHTHKRANHHPRRHVFCSDVIINNTNENSVFFFFFFFFEEYSYELYYEKAAAATWTSLLRYGREEQHQRQQEQQSSSSSSSSSCKESCASRGRNDDVVIDDDDASFIPRNCFRGSHVQLGHPVHHAPAERRAEIHHAVLAIRPGERRRGEVYETIGSEEK